MSDQTGLVDDMGEPDWARICRIEAARTMHRKTRDFLLELALEYEMMSGNTAKIHPDDPDLQNAVAERLHACAAVRRKSARG
jgi:hypothetical protein